MDCKKIFKFTILIFSLIGACLYSGWYIRSHPCFSSASQDLGGFYHLALSNCWSGDYRDDAGYLSLKAFNAHGAIEMKNPQGVKTSEVFVGLRGNFEQIVVGERDCEEKVVMVHGSKTREEERCGGMCEVERVNFETEEIGGSDVTAAVPVKELDLKQDVELKLGQRELQPAPTHHEVEGHKDMTKTADLHGHNDTTQPVSIQSPAGIQTHDSRTQTAEVHAYDSKIQATNVQGHDSKIQTAEVQGHESTMNNQEIQATTTTTKILSDKEPVTTTIVPRTTTTTTTTLYVTYTKPTGATTPITLSTSGTVKGSGAETSFGLVAVLAVLAIAGF